MADKIYSVICTDTAPELQWQCELLEHTWREVGQPGELIRLVAAADDQPLPVHTHMRVVPTPPSNVHPGTGDHYVPYNRLYSFDAWLRNEGPEGTVIVLDPDMVFRAAWPAAAAPGAPVGQRWVDFGTGQFLADALDVDLAALQHVTWPMAIHTSDLSRLMPDWIARTAEIRGVLGRWESDMYALVAAAADQRLAFSLQTTCAWMNWPEADVAGAPLIHYCQPVDGRDGQRVWYKRDYRPWDTGFDPSAARLDYCRDLLEIVRSCAQTRG